MSVFSLCSGIGGLDEGLRRAGFEHVAFCEGSPDDPGTGAYRRAVLERRFPGVPVFEDVASLRIEPAPRDQRDGRVTVSDGAGRVHTVAVPRVVSFGFPCQDLSVAGRRAGLAGERSGLFFECCRVVESLRPGWLLVENVPGLLSSEGGRDFGVVLGTLADLGYGVAWRVLDSRFFGVPQRRRRVFIVGAKSVGDPRAAAERAGEVLAVGSRCPGHPATRGEAGPDVASTLGGSVGKGRGHDGNPFDRGGHSSLSGLGNGGPDDNDAQAGRLVTTALHATQDPISGVISPAMGKEESGAIAVAFAWQQGDDSKFNENGRGRSWITRAGDYTGALGKSRYDAVAGEEVGVRRLTPRECERLQGLPDDWTLLDEKTPDSKRYSAVGDAVTVNVAEWIGRRLAA